MVSIFSRFTTYLLAHWVQARVMVFRDSDGQILVIGKNLPTDEIPGIATALLGIYGDRLQGRLEDEAEAQVEQLIRTGV